MSAMRGSPRGAQAAAGPAGAAPLASPDTRVEDACSPRSASAWHKAARVTMSPTQAVSPRSVPSATRHEARSPRRQPATGGRSPRERPGRDKSPAQASECQAAQHGVDTEETEATWTSFDALGVERGKCRCRRCKTYRRQLHAHGASCGNCGCAGHLHRRKSLPPLRKAPSPLPVDMLSQPLPRRVMAKPTDTKEQDMSVSPVLQRSKPRREAAQKERMPDHVEDETGREEERTEPVPPKQNHPAALTKLSPRVKENDPSNKLYAEMESNKQVSPVQKPCAKFSPRVNENDPNDKFYAEMESKKQVSSVQKPSPRKSTGTAASSENQSQDRVPVSSAKSPKLVESDAASEKLQRRILAEIEGWRNKVQFAVLQKDHQRAADLCDTMLSRLNELGDTRKRWRLPVLVQRAKVYVAWARGAPSLKILQSRLKCAKLDCINVVEECSEASTSLSGMNQGILGLGIVMRATIDLMNGHLANASKGFAKGKELVAKNSEHLVAWGFDFVTLAVEQTALIKETSKITTQAESALRDHKPKVCLRLVESLLESAPASVKAHSIKAEALAKMKHYQEALDFCGAIKAQIVKGIDKRLHANLSIVESTCWYDLGNIDKAILALKEADPAMLDASHRAKVSQMKRMKDLKQKGNSAFSAAQYDKAIGFYTSCLSIDKHNAKFCAVLHCNRGAAHMSQGAFKLAIQDCDIALQLDPSFSKALLRRARAGAQCSSEAALQRARADFEKVFRQDPSKVSTCKQEFLELEVKIVGVQKKAQQTKAANRPVTAAAPSEEGRKSTRPRPKTAGATRAPSKQPPQRKTTTKPHQPLPSEYEKFKSWKEKQDDNWRDYFRGKKQANRTGGFKSKSSRPKSASSSSSWRGRTSGFAANNSTEWVDGQGKVKDFYTVMGLRRDSDMSRSQIKKTFHRLALAYHPDKNQGDSSPTRRAKELKFKAISEAYGVLGEDNSREQYDRFCKCMAM